MEDWLGLHYNPIQFFFLSLGLSGCHDHSPPYRAAIAVSYRWGMVSLPLPYVIKMKILQLFNFFFQFLGL